MIDTTPYRAVKHPERGGDGWIVVTARGRYIAADEPMPHPDAVVLAERLNLHAERIAHWDREVMNPRGPR